MNLPATRDVFTEISRSVEAFHGVELLCGRAGSGAVRCEGGAPVTLAGLRAQARSHEAGAPSEVALWHHIAHHLREEAEGDGEQRWTLITVWLLATRLRGVSWWFVRHTGAERDDVCSALLNGLLEGVRSVEASDPVDVERHLVSAACAAGGRTGRRHREESPAGERDMAPPDRAAPPPTRAPGEIIHVNGMSRDLARRMQGERLGALAHRLGLLPHVRQVRRNNRSHSRCVGDRPRLFELTDEQTCLFETWVINHGA
ncbi:hypothetical protein GA0115239_104830 [Streptomyces sp. BpilaLS-43]|uniref:hypothetical protein n=1 Tax=Streptomyces sp. BpilaLS-43 TaxID=1839778 RepID=UPI00081B9738|nr:hypothetical protein [Streptomyces sp. BpilaLS-43]SCD64097.1 hypothetical protein GA0115239_104830 [Streptomyces sp. BpilaLS-43]